MGQQQATQKGPVEGTAEHAARSPARPRRALILGAVASGLLIGVVDVLIATAHAGLIFSRGLAVHLPAGVGLLLVSTTVILVVTALTASVPGTIGHVQDTFTVILALIAGSLASQTTLVGQDLLLTVVAAMTLASVVAGAFFFALGALRLGNLVHFLPFPVIGGFLAGTGWLLVRGSVTVMTGLSVELSTLRALFDAEALLAWGPGMTVGAVLVLAVRRTQHALTVPVVLLTALLAFFGVLAASGASMAEAQARGWTLGPIPPGALWRPVTASAVAHADWLAIAGQMANIATLLIVSVVALVLNASGVELLTRRDTDFNRELRAAGLGNILAGAAGGVGGYQSVSLTALAQRMGAPSRLVGVVAAGVCTLTLVNGAAVLAFVPKALLGALLAFLGFGFLVEWVYDARTRLSPSEHGIVLIILTVIAAAGFLQGVAVGMGVAVAWFVVAYSRTEVVKHELSGADFRSNVDRRRSEREVLRRSGDQICVLELQGFLFFGSANALAGRIERRAKDPTRSPLRFLTLDLRRVTGLDSTAVFSLVKVRDRTRSWGAALLISGASPDVERQLERGGLHRDEDGYRPCDDVDHAMEWCEQRVLQDAGLNGVIASDDDPLAGILPAGRDVDSLHPYVERFDVAPGDVLIKQGDGSSDLYLVAYGRLTVLVAPGDGRTVRLRVVGPGSVVGEIGLLRGIPRTASVVADEPSHVYRLSAAALEDMGRRDPELAMALLRFLGRELGERLTDVGRTLASVLD